MGRLSFRRLLTAAAAFFAAAVLCSAALPAGAAAGADSAGPPRPAELDLYLMLARVSERAYDDTLSGLETTPSGCTALVEETAGGGLIIAFRGSMLADRNPAHPFSSFGGANVRRAYRDWAATNLKQTAGFLPRQYTEAAALAEKLIRRHPADKPVFITGHSKGGGAAAYAYAAVCLSPDIPKKQAERIRCITFNAAVVREQNWRRLFRTVRDAASIPDREPAAGSVHAVVMAGDPVSKIAAAEERRYVRRIVLSPEADLSPGEQHGIRAVIEELEKMTGR